MTAPRTVPNARRRSPVAPDPTSPLVLALVAALIATVGVVVGLTVGAWTSGSTVTGPVPSSAKTSVTYLGCVEPGVHAWLFPDGSGAVMPAGSDCPDAPAAGSPTGEEKP